jgi:nitrogen-specific signal transduction histidine kinase
MLSRYSLQAKFLMGLTAATLVLGVVFAVGFYMHMRTVLEAETREKAELIFFQVDSVQNYVRRTLRPAMFKRLDDTFVIQAMSSSYITRAIMDQVRVASERHVYRRVAINSRNPDFEANGLERELIRHFRAHPGKTMWQGYKTINGSSHFVTARPVTFKPSCLRCHGDPADAPPELVSLYGNRGFGHEPGTIGGLDFVGLPVQASVARVRQTVISYLVIFAMASSLFFLMTHIVFSRVVVSSMRTLTRVFRRNLTDAEGEAILQEIEQGDEIHELIDGVEKLGDHLCAAREQLQEYAATLEDRVAGRTEDLARLFAEREADVHLFVRLLAGMNQSNSRPELWRQCLPLLRARFNLSRVAYVCTFASRNAYTWPEGQGRPELPQEWLALLTESRVLIRDGQAFIPVESAKGSAEGLLCLYRREGEVFGPEDEKLLLALGRQLGIAAENIEAMDSIVRHSANLQSIFEGITDPLLLLEGPGSVVMVNDAAIRLGLELSRGRETGGNLVPYLCPKQGPDQSCRIGRVIARKRPETHVATVAGGRSFSMNLYPLSGSGQDRVIVYIRETTREKRMLEQVSRAEKLATVGKLSAGLAHEINNPLGVILCYAELLRKSVPGREQQEDLEVIIKHTRQARRVLGDLLNFARPTVNTDQPSDLCEVASSVAEVFRVQAEKKGGRISVRCGPDLPRVRVEPDVVEQVVVNLLLNSLDAVPEGAGEIRLDVAHDAGRQEVVLIVVDNGPGIAEHDLGQVFDPFFSTKEVNKGTGLGLTLVYGVMQDLGGSVQVENDPGGGARFTLGFPVQENSFSDEAT